MFRTRQADGVLLQAVTRGAAPSLQVMCREGWGLAGPGMGYWSELAGRGSFPGEKRQLGSLVGSLLPSLGPTGNNALSSLALSWVVQDNRSRKDSGLKMSWSRQPADPFFLVPASGGRAWC